MQWELIIYDEDTCNHYIDMKVFNDPKEISDMLKKYEGYWCRIIDLTSLEILLEGAFDSSYLDKGYYEQDLEEKWKSIVKGFPTSILCCGIGIDDYTIFVLDLTTEENFKTANEYLKTVDNEVSNIENYANVRKKVIIEMDRLDNPGWYVIYGDIDEYFKAARAFLEDYMK